MESKKEKVRSFMVTEPILKVDSARTKLMVWEFSGTALLIFMKGTLKMV
jgi:hypothetical protein